MGADPFSAQVRLLQSLSFVSPVARTGYGLLIAPQSLSSLGAGSMLGAVLGAFVASVLNRGVRWDAFDDPREMGRHLAGACLMGVGGV